VVATVFCYCALFLILRRVLCTKPAICIVRHIHPSKLTQLSGLGHDFFLAGGLVLFLSGVGGP